MLTKEDEKMYKKNLPIGQKSPDHISMNPFYANVHVHVSVCSEM